MKDKARKGSLKNLKKVLSDMRNDLGYKLCTQADFWKSADAMTQQNKDSLTLFAAYLLSYYSFEEWKKKLVDEPLMISELTLKYKEFFGRKISCEDLRKGLAFINRRSAQIKKHHFEELMEEFSTELSSASNQPRIVNLLKKEFRRDKV